MERTVCQHYLKGSCRFGNSCKFEHSKPQAQGFAAFGGGGGGGGFGAFGQPNNLQPSNTSMGLFGAFQQQQPTTSAFGSFGSAPSAPTSGFGSFGQPASQSATSGFGAFGQPASQSAMALGSAQPVISDANVMAGFASAFAPQPTAQPFNQPFGPSTSTGLLSAFGSTVGGVSALSNLGAAPQPNSSSGFGVFGAFDSKPSGLLGAQSATQSTFTPPLQQPQPFATSSVTLAPAATAWGNQELSSDTVQPGLRADAAHFKTEYLAHGSYALSSYGSMKGDVSPEELRWSGAVEAVKERELLVGKLIQYHPIDPNAVRANTVYPSFLPRGPIIVIPDQLISIYTN